MTPLPKQYIAEIRKEGYQLALRLNGIDMAEYANQSAGDFAARLNVWLRHGRNELTAHFRPDGRPAPDESSLKVSLTDAEQRETMLFDSGNTSGSPTNYVIDIAETTGSVLETAPPIGSLSDADRAAIIGVVADVHAALNAKHADRLVQLQAIQLEEKAIAVGLPPDSGLTGYRDFLTELWGPTTWRAPFDRQALIVTPTALPNVVHVQRRSGEPAVECGNGEMRFSINPYLAKVQGSWRIVR